MDSAVVLSNHIVLEGFPDNVTAEKRETFLKVFKKQMTAKLGNDKFDLTLNSNENGLVFSAFVAFPTVKDADTAVSILNKWKFTKTTEIKAYYWADFEKFANVEDEFTMPEAATETLNRAELRANDFVLDPLARAQFLIKGGGDLNVEWYWLGKNKTADLIKKPTASRNDFVASWSEIDHHNRQQLQPGIPKEMPMWSTQGTYLVSHHMSGLKFWGGKGLQKLSEIMIDDLQFCKLSPCETYCITYARDYGFWNVLEGRKIRALAGPKIQRGDPESACPFKYSADDSMLGVANFSEPGKETLSFYHADSMKLISPDLTKYTAKAHGLTSFDWSPTNPKLFSCVIAGNEHAGWCVEVNEIETDGQIRNISRRNILHATDVRLLWHPDGSHIAARMTKMVNGQPVADYLSFTINPNNTVACHAVDTKDRQVIRFWWASSKSRFCVRYGPSSGEPPCIAFFTVEKIGCKCIGTVDGDYDAVWWSPKGQECVLVNTTKSSLDFAVVDEKGVERVAREKEHRGVTHLTWDPSGRYVASYVSTVGQEVFGDAGYKVWSVYGDLLCENSNMKSRFSHFSWRPTPATLLSKSELKSIEKNLPQLRARYEADDAEQLRKADEAASAKKNDAIAKYKQTMDAIALHQAEKDFAAKRRELQQSAPAMKRQVKILSEKTEMVTETETQEHIESEIEISMD